MPDEKRQLQPRPSTRTIRGVHPTHREVLLARLLLQVVDALGNHEDLDAALYDDVKAIAEPVVRSAHGAA